MSRRLSEEAHEHFYFLKEVVNRSENNAQRVKVGLPHNMNHIMEQINRDFFTLDYIARKHAPMKVPYIKKLHSATIACLGGQISEEKYEKILREFGQRFNVRTPGIDPERLRNSANNFSHSINHRMKGKNPFADVHKMFQFGSR